MKKIFQINSVVNEGSTGRIAEGIGKAFIENNWESVIAYGRGSKSSSSKLIKIGSGLNILSHVLYSRFTDRHGFASKKSTMDLVKTIDNHSPEVVVLHNLHGYYINIRVLFNYLKKSEVPVLWVLHDCWAFTGHCAYFDQIGCTKWQRVCEKCPQKDRYPKSFIDNSQKNYIEKREIFNSLTNLIIVTPSMWLKQLVKKSFLKKHSIKLIYNGIDLEQFTRLDTFSKKNKLVLGVANSWSKRKGLNDFFMLRKLLGNKYEILLVGLTQKQINSLPPGIDGLKKTASVKELVRYYNLADVFVNPTYEDNFPTTNLEALACDTPVATYKTGGSHEAIDENTGICVNKGDVYSMAEAVIKIIDNADFYKGNCRRRAKKCFDMNNRYDDYFWLVNSMI